MAVEAEVLKESSDGGMPSVPITVGAGDGLTAGRLLRTIPGPASERGTDSDFWARSVFGWAPPIFSSKLFPAPEAVLLGYLSTKTTRFSLAQSSAPISWYAFAREYRASAAMGYQDKP